jgi:hypothetical protein
MLRLIGVTSMIMLPGWAAGVGVAVVDLVTTAQNVAVQVNVLANDTGFSFPATVTITTAPSHGGAIVSGSPGAPGGVLLTYTPTAGFVGTDSLVYRVTDGVSISTATVTATVLLDTDLDGIPDLADNCTLVANATQLDTDADGYGNICDPDFNNDGTVNINDFNRLKARLNITPVVDLATDLDGNGAVNINDFNRLKSFLGKPPGPSRLRPTTTTYAVVGQVTGLSGTGLVLRNNGGDNLAISANGPFAFATALTQGSAYLVTVLTQPTSPSQTCGVVSSSIGTVGTGLVPNVLVTCSTFTATPGFTALSANMNSARATHTATRLASGKIFITGGFSANAFPSPALNTTELYSALTQTFTVPGATMTSLRAAHAATLLPNGKVLLTGGQIDNNNGDGSATAELYDPVANSFTPLTATLTTPRGGHTSTLLPNGRVLIAGGFNNNSISLNTAELFDPVTQTFTPVIAAMTSHRANHMATLLPSGQVLLTGGSSAGVTFNTAEVYDPVGNSFTALVPTMTTVRSVHTATLLPNGRVLLAGGGILQASGAFTVFNTAELYDPVANSFTPLATTMTTPRIGHAASLLPNGQVLLTGGGNGTSTSAFTVFSTAEAYSP